MVKLKNTLPTELIFDDDYDDDGDKHQNIPSRKKVVSPIFPDVLPPPNVKKQKIFNRKTIER